MKNARNLSGLSVDSRTFQLHGVARISLSFGSALLLGCYDLCVCFHIWFVNDPKKWSYFRWHSCILSFQPILTQPYKRVHHILRLNTIIITAALVVLPIELIFLKQSFASAYLVNLQSILEFLQFSKTVAHKNHTGHFSLIIDLPSANSFVLIFLAEAVIA